MLLELKIKNFIIIESESISFKQGFNVLSGETGSGKSVLLKGLAVLMGSSSSNDQIGPYGQEANIEGFFDISERDDIKLKLLELGLDNEEETFIVRRIIGKKNRVFINGSLVTLAELKNLVTPMLEIAGPFSAPLMEMTGQHDTKQLLSTSYHRFLLDLYAGLSPKLEKYKAKFSERDLLLAEIENIRLKSQDTAHQLDFIKYQLAELQNFEIDLERDSGLKDRIYNVKNKQKFLDFIALSDELLNQRDNSVLSSLGKVLKSSEPFLDKAGSLSQKGLTEALQNLKTGYTLIEDASFELANFAPEDFENEDTLEQLTERFTKLRHLQKKYGDSLQSIVQAERNLSQEIEILENSDVLLEEKEANLEKLETELMGHASELHDQRKAASDSITKKVNDQLADLNMKGVEFHIGLQRLDELNKYGYSKIEFLVQSHKESGKRALAKTASGGELSRILLSIKTVLGENEWPRTYLFDEVDTGVSGPTAELVGKKLKELSFDQQVLCVTHLPQVAAQADHHFIIEKVEAKGSVLMKVHELNKKQRIDEIARLISGTKISDASRKHAEDLLKI